MPLFLGLKRVASRSWSGSKAVGQAVRVHRRLTQILIFLSVFSTAIAIHERSHASTANVCDVAARQAANETGVPLSVLWSITRTETGRAQQGKLKPWPWTVNMEGKGRWFENEANARNYVQRHYRNGARSFDVGCFQINYKWHGSSFSSIDHMFDPLENARYAAAFLMQLYRETGDWSLAAGAYHSRTPKYADRYRARFERIRKSHGSEPSELARLQETNSRSPRKKSQIRKNSFPLLIATDVRRSNGSLVPLQRRSSGALFDVVTN